MKGDKGAVKLYRITGLTFFKLKIHLKGIKLNLRLSLLFCSHKSTHAIKTTNILVKAITQDPLVVHCSSPPVCDAS